MDSNKDLEVDLYYFVFKGIEDLIGKKVVWLNFILNAHIYILGLILNTKYL